MIFTGDEIASRYPNDNAVMVLDGAGWHIRNSTISPSKTFRANGLELDPQGRGDLQEAGLTFWSRRIDDSNRLIYCVDGDDLVVIACRYHYD